MQKGTISKAGIAQLVERFTRNEDVGGSIPLSGTSIKKARICCGLFCCAV